MYVAFWSRFRGLYILISEILAGHCNVRQIINNWELSWKNEGFKYSRSWEVRFRNLRLPILKIIVKTSKRRHTPKMAVVCSQSLFDKTATCWNVVKLRSLGGGLRKKQRLLKPMIPQVVDPLHSIPPKNTVTILRKYSACPIFFRRVSGIRTTDTMYDPVRKVVVKNGKIYKNTIH